MTWIRKNKNLPSMSEFDAEKSYTTQELDAFAEVLLRKDAKERPIRQFPAILFAEHDYNRKRREIYCEQGYPDEAITQTLSRDGQMLFNRTHPQGRKVNSADARSRHGASYYR